MSQPFQFSPRASCVAVRRQRQRRRAVAGFFALFCAFVAVSSPALAQLPSGRLTSLFPPGGKVGSTVELTVTGADLDGAAEMRFSHPGITAKTDDKSDNAASRKFTISISNDVPPGIYEARVVSRFGITNPRAFCVGDFTEILPGKDSSAPQKLPIGSVANGRCSNTVNEYLVDLKKDQHVVVQCAAREIDSKMIPVMLLNSAEGRELARSRRGGVIDFTAPDNGTYTLQVHDLLYRNGESYPYRVSIGEGPYLDAIFPPAGLPGSKSKYTLYGRNLPGGKPSKFHGADGKTLDELEVEIELPSDPTAPAKSDAIALLGALGSGVDAVAYRLKSDKGVSNPVLIGFARAPLVIEQEPNNSPAKAQKITPPCEVVGRFYPRGDQDVFTFEAGKGDVYWIEILSERFGLPTSPELLVQKVGKSAKGEEQVSDIQDFGGPDMQPMGKKGGGASAAYPAPSRDVEYRFEAAKEAGTYRLTVRDLFNETTDNSALIYRMSLHKESPDFRLLATSAPIIDAKNPNSSEPTIAPPFLRKGGAAPIRVNIFRKDGFDGEVRIEAQGLPPGVQCTSGTITPDETSTMLLLTADESAEGWAGSIHIVGKAKIGEGEQTREARVGAVIWATDATDTKNPQRLVARLTDEMALAVSAEETEPLSINVEKSSLETKVNAKIKVPVKVNKRIEVKQPLKLAGVGLPKGAKLELTIPPDATSGSLDLDPAALKLSPGTYTFYLQTQVQVKYDRKTGAPDKTAKKADGGAKGKNKGKDTQATFYSQPITLKILPK